MKIHDCQTKITRLDLAWEHPVELVTWVMFNGEHNATVRGIGVEVSAGGATRGEAMSTLVDALRQLGREVATLASEQEGVTGLTMKDLAT